MNIATIGQQVADAFREAQIVRHGSKSWRRTQFMYPGE